MKPQYLSPKEAGSFLGVSVNLLQKWRTQGVGIPYAKMGSSSSSIIRYKIDDLLAYVENQKIQVM